MENDFGLCDLSLEEFPGSQCNSPFLKRTKTSTPHKIAQETPANTNLYLTETFIDEEMAESLISEDDQEMIVEINRMLPAVIKELRNIDQLQNWLSFHQMVQDECFPLENIAFHLFMDVCKFYSLGNTASMRFSPTVKRFWRIGYCLFHGKWLHFMSGPKNLGQKVLNPDNEMSAEHAEINFAVPYRATVGNSNKVFNDDEVKPGLLTPMINKLAAQTTNDKTFKLCVDGKKINAGKSRKSGDIDLFGFEKSPTLSERKATLESETVLLKSVSDILDVMSICQKVMLKQIPQNENKHLVLLLIEIIRVVGEKVHTLRETKVNKDLMLEKLKKQSGPDWRKSKFVFVISSLETDLYDVSNCIKELLNIVDEIGFTVATLRSAETLYAKGRSVSLNSQMNYIHISNTPTKRDAVEPRQIKQLSDEWHAIRNSAKVTGSSLNNALGLGSLKQQLEHFDKVFYKKESKQFSSDVQMKMKYGSEQEINAIATLVGKFLPVFEPSLIYVEEGCYKKSIGNEPNEVPIVISPDGSLRNSADSAASFGIECKCPFPGKLFTTPVYYKIPKYYVTQVLAEMFSLECRELYFICYSTESSTVFNVRFCPDLWRDLENETLAIYGQDHPVRPAKKSNRLFTIKEKIDKFVKENVKFVAEVPSILAEQCEIQTNEIYCIHTKPKSENNNLTVRGLQETIQKVTVCINRAYQLNRTRASEFLAVMVSDLDREYSSERYHAVPVAYGLKGYSLPTQLLRDMIEYVLRECWSKGLYIPVCSFDGQWFRMAVRDRHEKPLTLLQLQKDVYADVKKMSKSQIIKNISELNVVHLHSDVVPEDVIEIRREGKKLTLANGNKSERIVMTTSLIQLMKKSSDVEETNLGDSNQPDGVITDIILSSLPENYVNEIDEGLLDEVVVLASTVTDGSHQTEHGNKEPEHIDAIETLFDGHISQSDDNIMDADTVSESAHQSAGETTQSEAVTNATDPFLKTLNTQENINLMFSEIQSKYKNFEISLGELTLKLKSAETIDKSFNKNQIVALISPISGVLKSKGFKCNKSQAKYTLTNILSDIFGDGSRMQQKPIRKMKVPLSLKNLARKAVQKLPKIVLNCVYAQHVFPKALKRWQDDSPFGANIQIEGIKRITPTQWYSKPEFNDVIGSYLFVILDAYHQICGLRRVFCGPGMPKAGIYSKPVNIVAENSDSNGCGLSIALVRDMIDKQSIAYAVQTFSEKVEEALIEINACNEAYFNNMVRNWYLSEDEPGMSAQDRCSAKLEIRKWLLNGVRFDVFPPCGSHVKDIPVVLYEGLLIGMERKLQLYPFTKAGSYNVRAVGSLDIENFFGSFQDIDPRGTGVLRPDDIPIAIGVAMELLDARLDPERGFYMHTSKKRVYPSKQGMNASGTQLTMASWEQSIREVSTICLRDHAFDLPERRRGKRTRKSGKVSKPNQPARNPFPVREYHKASEAKILPHVRRGLKLQSLED